MQLYCHQGDISMMKKYLTGGGILLIFILALGFRIYYLNLKVEGGVTVDGVDESLSITLSEYNEYGWWKPFESNRIFDANEVKSAVLWNDPSIKGALKDIYRLWKDNRDPSHTNLYYSLLRLWHIGFANTDLDKIFYRGVSLNFLFFIFGFYFAYRIAQRLFQYEWMIFLFLCIAFFNPASINNTLFIRPYALQEMLFLAFCLSLIFIINKLKSDYVRYNNWRFYIPFGFLTALLMSSAYFATIFVAIIIFCASIWEFSFLKKDKNFKLFFPLSFIAALVFCKILYPKYFQAFHSGRGEEVGKKLDLMYLKESLINNTETWFNILVTNFSWSVLLIVLVGLCLNLVYHKKVICKKDILIVFLGIIALTWTFVIIYLAPYKILRYIMAIFPIISLLIPYAINLGNKVLFLHNIHKKVRFALVGILCGLCVFNTLPLDRQKIIYIDHDITKYQLIRDSQTLTVLIFQDIHIWRYASIVPILKSDIIFLNNCDDLVKILPQFKELRIIAPKEYERCRINTQYETYGNMVIQHYKNSG